MMRPVPFLFSPANGPVDMFEPTSFLHRTFICRTLVENAGDVILHAEEGAGNVVLHAIEDAGILNVGKDCS